MVLNTSVASMTSTDLITSLASMTSTASLASKNQKQPALYMLKDFPGIRNFGGLNDLYSPITSVASVTFSASFHQKKY